MYTNEDLNQAVKSGIFTASSVDEFRQSVSLAKETPSVDEENFKLIGGFNDIFVVIACCLLLFSSFFILESINVSLAYICFALTSWGLAEFFVLKKKMSLPAIVLLAAFVGSVFQFFSSLFPQLSEISLAAGAGGATIAATLHWWRFKVPITVAAGTVAALGLIVSSILYAFPSTESWLVFILFIAGLISFSLAMYWDSGDTTRTSRKSDVAFWLHLISAPLIIHPVFSALGVLEGNESLMTIGFVVTLYIIMTMISLIIDRRAFMVSSLVYVIYAISAVMDSFGGVGSGVAITGALMGAVLLSLSAFWQVSRKKIVLTLPHSIRRLVPVVESEVK